MEKDDRGHIEAAHNGAQLFHYDICHAHIGTGASNGDSS
jgi:hypothetical protein